jgi:NADH dehydrogenase
VDGELRVPQAPHVFAAGDTAAAVLESGQTVVQSCQHATPLGKHAGHNAAADLLGLPLATFSTIPYVTCLDLGAAGAVYTIGFERAVQLSGAEGKERKRLINQKWIYPPLDDSDEILRAADHRFSRRQADNVHA